MDKIIRFLLINCLASYTMFISAVTILEKQLNIGRDPKTEKILQARGFAFVEGSSATPDTHWICVYPYEKEIYVYSEKNDRRNAFPISALISTKTAFDIIIDPTTKQQAAAQDIRAGKPMITLHLTLDPQVQIFKNLVILMAKNDRNGLLTLINEHSLTTINQVIEKAVECQGECAPEPDDIEALAKTLQQDSGLNASVSFTGKVIFFSIAELAQEVMHLLEEQEQ
jgi:hypothetical protein